MKSKKSSDEWQELVGKFNKSGLSIANFSRQNNMNISTFTYWVKKINASSKKVAKLVKLPIPKQPSSTPILISVDGIKIEIANNIPIDKIIKIISVIRGGV